jgi:hypothetical protein
MAVKELTLKRTAIMLIICPFCSFPNNLAPISLLRLQAWSLLLTIRLSLIFGVDRTSVVPLCIWSH